MTSSKCDRGRFFVMFSVSLQDLTLLILLDFEVGPVDDRKVVEARFSFVWKKDDQGEWKIVHHHSSAKPKV